MLASVPKNILYNYFKSAKACVIASSAKSENEIIFSQTASEISSEISILVEIIYS